MIPFLAFPATLFKKAISAVKETTGVAKDVLDIKKTRLETKLIEKQVKTQESPIQLATLADIEKYDPKISVISSNWMKMLVLVVAFGGAITVVLFSKQHKDQSSAPNDDLSQVQSKPRTGDPQVHSRPPIGDPSRRGMFFPFHEPTIIRFAPIKEPVPKLGRCGAISSQGLFILVGFKDTVKRAEFFREVLTTNCATVTYEFYLQADKQLTPDRIELKLVERHPRLTPITFLVDRYHIRDDSYTYVLCDKNGKELAKELTRSSAFYPWP